MSAAAALSHPVCVLPGMEERGCVVGMQDSQIVTVRDHEVLLDGEQTRVPLADLSQPIKCDYCDKRLIKHHPTSPDRPFLRHLSGEAHPPPALVYGGESARHWGIKKFIADSYQYSHTWTARAEEYTGSRSRRPDVTCRPRQRRRGGRRRLVERVPTAYEVQLVDISVADLQMRTLDHRADGIETTFWLEAGGQPRQRPAIAAAVTLTKDDQVVGIANNAEEHWDARDWAEPIDLDKFCELHRRGDIVWVPNYGVLAYDAWIAYVDGAGSELDTRKRELRRSIDLTEHQSRHGEGIGPLADSRLVAPPGIVVPSAPVLWWERPYRAAYAGSGPHARRLPAVRRVVDCASARRALRARSWTVIERRPG
jgi:hypothetical protein